MDKLKWSDALAVGVEAVDEQHKTLIERAAAVSRAVEEHHGETEIVETLRFLTEYAEHHFAAEEGLMTDVDYPGLDAQQIAHQEFIDNLADLEQDFVEEGASHPLAIAMNDFLTGWLLHHIQTMDRELGQFLRNG